MRRNTLPGLLGAGLLLALGSIMLINLWRLPDVPDAPGLAVQPRSAVTVDGAQAAARLSTAIRVRTVSGSAGEADFRAFHRLLEQQFPLLHQRLQRDMVGPGSVLYTWQGSSRSLAPILLTAHIDTVAAAPAGWTHPPFSGAIADGHVWGRGAMDMKSALMATLEAVEALTRYGFTPRRTVLLAFSHDHESGAQRGAAALAALLRERNAYALFSLDEGAYLLQGFFPGVRRPVAQVGVAEKGYLSLQLQAHRDDSGASAIGRLGAALARLEETPMPVRMDGPGRDSLRTLAQALPLPLQLALANDRLMAPLWVRAATASPGLNAMLRTTSAPTMIAGGTPDGLEPASVSAVLNFRLAPGDTIADVKAHVRQAVADSAIALSDHGALRAEASMT
ncbi:MAG TPA: M20/M25/M40 family metallo-hydrolase, partial [Burkholderiaceae bacterium]